MSKEKENANDIVVWSDQFVTGIELIDNQHRELVDLTNQLYQACMGGNEQVVAAFKDTMSQMVEYVKYHFTTELELLKKINYPYYNDHKIQHDSLIKEILIAANEYQAGKKYTPHLFVRTLKDWVFSHIAYYDKGFAAFVAEQRSKGLLIDISP